LIRDSHFSEYAICLFAHFKRRLDLAGCSFHRPADFRYATIDGDFDVRNSKFLVSDIEDVDEETGKIVEADFGNLKTSGPIFLDGVVFDRPVRFYAAQSGNFEARN